MTKETVLLTQKTTLTFPKGTEIPLNLLLMGKQDLASNVKRSPRGPHKLGASATVMIDRKLAATHKLAANGGAPKKSAVLDALLAIDSDQLTRAELSARIVKATGMSKNPVSAWISTLAAESVIVAVDT